MFALVQISLTLSFIAGKSPVVIVEVPRTDPVEKALGGHRWPAFMRRVPPREQGHVSYIFESLLQSDRDLGPRNRMGFALPILRFE